MHIYIDMHIYVFILYTYNHFLTILQHFPSQVQDAVPCAHFNFQPETKQYFLKRQMDCIQLSLPKLSLKRFQ